MPPLLFRFCWAALCGVTIHLQVSETLESHFVWLSVKPPILVVISISVFSAENLGTAVEKLCDWIVRLVPLSSLWNLVGDMSTEM